ncbi:MAG: hypothetical protein GY870_08190 [archaeon]|nr:hypothetical protein [archaeon]
MAKSKKDKKKNLEKRRRIKQKALENKDKEKSKGFNYLNYDGDYFKIESKKVDIDILPFSLSRDMDDEGLEKGDTWYTKRFAVHKNVGSENVTIVCPKSFGKKCPICEEVTKLAEDWDENEDVIKEISKKDRELYNVLNDGEVQLWDVSIHLFGKNLYEEWRDGEDEWAGFYEAEDGFTLETKWKKKKFKKFDYYDNRNIEFEEREDIEFDEDDVFILDDPELFVLLSYKEIEKLFLDLDEEDVQEEEEEEEEKPKKKKSKSKKKSKKKKEPEPEEEEEEEPEDEPEEEPEEEDDESTCPVEDGTFGKDCYEFDECDDCEKFDACDDEQVRLKKEKEKKKDKKKSKRKKK